MNNYNHLVGEIQRLLTDSRRKAARSVNAVLTATYWEMCWPLAKISETLSRKLTTSDLEKVLALSWSHYVRLVKVKENG